MNFSGWICSGSACARVFFILLALQRQLSPFFYHLFMPKRPAILQRID